MQAKREWRPWALTALSAGMLLGLSRPGGSDNKLPPVDTDTISVGAPKVFDENALRLMLLEASNRLAALSFINGGDVSKAIGTLQGSETSTSAFGLGVTAALTPSITIKDESKTDTNAKGEQTTTDTLTKTATESSATPAPAALPSLPGAASAPTNFSVGASDLLNEQMELTYQVMNLRLLLDRAISDRLSFDAPTADKLSATGVRPQAIIGFQVSVAPKEEYQDKLAEVILHVKYNPLASYALDKRLTEELRKNKLDQHGRYKTQKDWAKEEEPESVTTDTNISETDFTAFLTEAHLAETDLTKAGFTKAGLSKEDTSKIKWRKDFVTQNPISLVALLPRQKSYNVATVTQKATQFGFGAAVSVLNIGASSNKSNSSMFLVRDIDTVALERPGNALIPDTVNFGWQFRPVLRRRAVDAGTRQVYAVLALPNTTDHSFVGDVTATIRWRCWDRHHNAMGFIVAEERDIKLPPVKILRSKDRARLLGPQIKDVHWTDIGDGKLVVDVDGENFVAGTQVAIGDQLLSTDNNRLAISGETHLHFLTTEEDLVQIKEPQIATRFGIRDLQTPGVIDQAQKASPTNDDYGIDFYRGDKSQPPVSFKLTAPNACKVTVRLVSRNGHGDTDIDGHYFTVRIGKKVYPLSKDNVIAPKDTKAGVYQIQFPARASDIVTADSLLIRRLFWGQHNRAVISLDDESLGSEIAKLFVVDKFDILGPHDKSTAIGVRGAGFTHTSNAPNSYAGYVYAGARKADTVDFVNSSLIIAHFDSKDLKTAKQLRVEQEIDKNKVVYMFPLKAAGLRQPAINPIIVHRGDETEVKVTGANLDSIATIKYKDSLLAAEAGDDGASLVLGLTQGLTKSIGKKQLVAILNDGTVLDPPIVVQVVPADK